ncbi:MAG: hypothetical protein NPIRA01_28170 [Nitrospirales bacterium]|nr:MAG: hypothetical protein NPIRA01_28170 [Nitrospirales bacterium]
MTIERLTFFVWILALFDRLGMNSHNERMRVIVSEKGQVIIPRQLRERLGLHTGQILDVQEKERKFVATKLPTSDTVDTIFGILKRKQKTDQIIKDLRGKADPR